MIASLTGEIALIEESAIILNVHGVGFRVMVPKYVAASKNLGDLLTLFTHLLVRENDLSLVGFETAEEKQFFLLLLGVDGIGPKVALSILSTLSIDAIYNAIESEEPDLLSKVPGVGKRTAQKIQLYLKDKLNLKGGAGFGVLMTESDTDLLAALTALGYSVVESQRAIQALPKGQALSLEDKIRLCLSNFQ